MTYKLTYFELASSRGEECRVALFVAGVKFEDYRVPRGEWPALKPNAPYGSLPFLEITGKPPLAQSNAILAYVGRAHDLHPKDLWEAALHEAIMESVEEVRAMLQPSGKLTDQKEKKAAREALASGPLQLWGARIEKQIKGPFLAGEKICVADIKVHRIVDALKSGVMDHIPSTVFAAFPQLEALYAAVSSHPKVVEWRALHPTA
ncbi:MAG TPA: glutathione S-transferase family protein [Polyangiaceae bacterium]|nr:glutathione S-transferase family protein [Polyangiaceae bacterium]